jgi:hypothetical protein
MLLTNDILYLSWFDDPIILFLYTKGVEIFQKSSSFLINFRHKKTDIRYVSNLGPTNNRHHHAKFSCLGDLTPAICTALLFTSSETCSNSINTGTKDSSNFILSKSKYSFWQNFFLAGNREIMNKTWEKVNSHNVHKVIINIGKL